MNPSVGAGLCPWSCGGQREQLVLLLFPACFEFSALKGRPLSAFPSNVAFPSFKAFWSLQGMLCRRLGMARPSQPPPRSHCLLPPGSHPQGIPLPPVWPGTIQPPLWALGWKLRGAASRRRWVALEQGREQSGHCPATGAQRVAGCPLVLR